jgi:hypothetical protein
MNKPESLTPEEIHNLDPDSHAKFDKHRIDFAKAIEAEVNRRWIEMLSKQQPVAMVDYSLPNCVGWGSDECPPDGTVLHVHPALQQEPVAWAKKAMELATDFAIESLRLGSYERKDIYEHGGRASYQTINLREKREAARERLREFIHTTHPAPQQEPSCPDCKAPHLLYECVHCGASNYPEKSTAPQQETTQFLANGTRFKLSIDDEGKVNCFGNYKELNGRWVALVAAEDDCHLKPAPQQKPQKLLLEHSGCGHGTQVEQVTVRLNRGDKVVLLMGPYTAATEAKKMKRDALELAVDYYNIQLELKERLAIFEEIIEQFCMDAEAQLAPQQENIQALLKKAAYEEENLAARKTVMALGYTYHGGELWKPPLGPLPQKPNHTEHPLEMVRHPQINGWIRKSELDQAKKFGGSINLWLERHDCDTRVFIDAAHGIKDNT